jgi:hypothetical protein
MPSGSFQSRVSQNSSTFRSFSRYTFLSRDEIRRRSFSSSSCFVMLSFISFNLSSVSSVLG